LAGWIIGIIVALAIALAVEERSGLLAAGTPAPDFSASLSTGKRFALADYRGKNPVVLFFYPADFTQGCTQEVCEFRDGYDALAGEGAVVIGISQDTHSSHARFSEEYHLPFPLVSDADHAISRAYGVERLGGFVPMPKRVTYVIDEEGIVRAAIHHEFMIHRHIDEVREALKGILAG
jgi:peroxiredoxin Q/BCP